MPRLRSLTFTFIGAPDALTAMAPTYPSLTELALPVLNTEAIVTLVTLPTIAALRSLALTLALGLRTPNQPADLATLVQRWIQRHTALTSLALGFSGTVPEEGWTLLAEAPCLTRLSMSLTSPSPARLASVLAPHTRLCSLRLAESSPTDGGDELVRVVGSRLTELQPMFHNADLAISVCTGLRTLAVLPIHASQVTTWHLPGLRGLTVLRRNPAMNASGTDLGVCDAMRLVLDVVRVHTELRTLTILTGFKAPPMEEFWACVVPYSCVCGCMCAMCVAH